MIEKLPDETIAEFCEDYYNNDMRSMAHEIRNLRKAYQASWNAVIQMRLVHGQNTIASQLESYLREVYKDDQQ